MRMSIERRRVAVMGGATAAMSGLGGVMRQRGFHTEIAWMVLEGATIFATIVSLVLWRRSNPACEG